MRSALTLLVAASSAFICAAWDLSKEITAQPAGSKFGVKLDYNLAKSTLTVKKKNQIFDKLFSTHLTFTEDVSKITDGQLLQIAIDAYWHDLPLAKKQYDGDQADGKTKWIQYDPSVMVAMAFGKEIFISSSQRGSNFAYTSSNSLVAELLETCKKEYWGDAVEETADKNGNHINDAKCAEVLAAQQFYVKYPGTTKDLKTQKARIVAVQRRKTGDTFSEPTIEEPCGTGATNGWGCNVLTTKLGVTPISKNTKPQSYGDIKSLAGTLTISQVNVGPLKTTKRFLESRIARQMDESSESV